MIIFLLTIAVAELAFLVGWLVLNSRKIDTFLTWNIRYESVEYEQAITKPKHLKLPGKPSKTERKGRSITPVDDLVDLSDLDFDQAVKAVEAISDGQ